MNGAHSPGRLEDYNSYAEERVAAKERILFKVIPKHRINSLHL